MGNVTYECSRKRMQDKIGTMSRFGDAGNGGITRYALSSEDIQARDEFVRRMKAIGCNIKTDDMANVYAVLPGSEPELPGTVMIFVPSKDGHSHCESEYTSVEQCTMGASVLLNAVLACDRDVNQA